jgi:hypothetical protein
MAPARRPPDAPDRRVRLAHDLPDRRAASAYRTAATDAGGTRRGPGDCSPRPLRLPSTPGVGQPDRAAPSRVDGKGRKQRAVPLTKPVKQVLAVWLAERRGQPDEPLFPTRTGRRLSRDAVERRVATHAATAMQQCASLDGKRIHPHVLRHSCAMSLLQAGVDSNVIALWLGHADVRSTKPYIHADMTIKERAVALVTPPSAKPGRYTPSDAVLAYRDSLGQLCRQQRRRRQQEGRPSGHRSTDLNPLGRSELRTHGAESFAATVDSGMRSRPRHVSAEARSSHSEPVADALPQRPRIRGARYLAASGPPRTGRSAGTRASLSRSRGS